MFLSECFGFPMPLLFHQCRLYSVFMLRLLLPEGHASETRVPSNKQCFFFPKWRSTGWTRNFTLSPLSVECDTLLTFESQRVMNSSERHQNVRPTLKATGCVNGTGRRMCLYMCLALHLASSEPCQKPRHSFLTLILFFIHG
jgi:hypothetical protein